MECKKNLTPSQIIQELAKDDLGECNSCQNLEYKNGLLICKMASTEKK